MSKQTNSQVFYLFYSRKQEDMIAQSTTPNDPKTVPIWRNDDGQEVEITNANGENKPYAHGTIMYREVYQLDLTGYVIGRLSFFWKTRKTANNDYSPTNHCQI